MPLFLGCHRFFELKWQNYRQTWTKSEDLKDIESGKTDGLRLKEHKASQPGTDALDLPLQRVGAARSKDHTWRLRGFFVTCFRKQGHARRSSKKMVSLESFFDIQDSSRKLQGSTVTAFSRVVSSTPCFSFTRLVYLVYLSPLSSEVLLTSSYYPRTQLNYLPQRRAKHGAPCESDGETNRCQAKDHVIRSQELKSPT